MVVVLLGCQVVVLISVACVPVDGDSTKQSLMTQLCFGVGSRQFLAHMVTILANLNILNNMSDIVQVFQEGVTRRFWLEVTRGS